MIMKTVWITKDILNWVVYPSRLSGCVEGKAERSYQMWQHAEAILQSPTNEFERVDVIATLKRTLDLRLKLLNELYKFDKIPIRNLPRGRIQQLQYFGIAKPLMAHTLLSIRNRIEHQDAAPPDHKECERLHEFVWYFLRSTDVYVAGVITRFTLNAPDHYDSDHWLEIKTHPSQDWVLNVMGWLPSHYVSNVQWDGWFKVECNRYFARGQFYDDHIAQGNTGITWSRENANRDDLCVDGVLTGDNDALSKLYMLYFM
jgi:hypothetical protein